LFSVGLHWLPYTILILILLLTYSNLNTIARFLKSTLSNRYPTYVHTHMPLAYFLSLTVASVPQSFYLIRSSSHPLLLFPPSFLLSLLHSRIQALSLSHYPSSLSIPSPNTSCFIQFFPISLPPLPPLVPLLLLPATSYLPISSLLHISPICVPMFLPPFHISYTSFPHRLPSMIPL